MTIKTFNDLESVTNPSSSDVLDLISDHAVNGLEIQSRIVLGLIKKTKLSTEDLDKVRLYSQVGIFYWNKYGNIRATNEYKEVLDGVNNLS